MQTKFSIGLNTMKTGYYLVTPDNERHYIGPTVNPYALEKACDRHLSAATNWQYWVDYLHGFDVKGNLAWSNIDHTDNFI